MVVVIVDATAAFDLPHNKNHLHVNHTSTLTLTLTPTTFTPTTLLWVNASTTATTSITSSTTTTIITSTPFLSEATGANGGDIDANATNATTTAAEDWWGSDVDDVARAAVVGTILMAIVLSTVVGNVMVLLAVFVNSHLRSTTNYFIVNLAIADLLLGTMVLPLSASQEVFKRWLFGQVVCDIWAAIDVLCCTASIFSLCVISIDRYLGVTRPLQRSTIMTERRAVYIILAIWLLAMAISVAPLFGWKEDHSSDPYECTVTTQTGYVLFSVATSFYIPLLIILLVYFRIYREAIKHSRFLRTGVKTTKVDESGVTLRVHKGGSGGGGGGGRGGGGGCSPNVHPKTHHHHHPNPGGGGMMGSSSPQQGLLSQKGTLCSPSSSSSHAFSNCGPSTNTTTMTTTTTTIPVGHQSSSSSSERSEESSSVGGHGKVPARSALAAGKVARFKRETKAAKTLGIVVGVFILCWFPFFFILPLGSLCASCNIPPLVFSVFFWLGYGNSLMNPIIYACSSREFQFAFRRILRCQFRRRPRVFLADHDEKSNNCHDFGPIDAATSNRSFRRKFGRWSRRSKSHKERLTHSFRTYMWSSRRKCQSRSVPISMDSYDTTPSSNELCLAESPTDSLRELQRQIGVVTVEQTAWPPSRPGDGAILRRGSFHNEDVFRDLTNEETYLKCGAG